MYAVVRHTFELTIPEPFVKSSQKSIGRWVHKVWVHDSELDAIAHAIKLLDEPLLKHDEWAMDIAIEQLKNNRFYQLGKESVAIAEVEPSPDIVYLHDDDNQIN